MSHYIQQAGIIKRQIRLDTHMAVGSRKFVAGEENQCAYLQFNVGPSSAHMIMQITLSPNDTYKITLYKFLTKTLTLKVLNSVENVFVNELNQAIYSMINK